MRIPTILAASLLLVAATRSAAQSPCVTNLVPNGDFENPVVDLWSVRGDYTASYSQFQVDGLVTSRCIELQPTASTATGALVQQAPFQVVAGRVYEVFFETSTNARITADLGVTVAGVRNSLAIEGIQIGKTRVAQPFTPNVSGQATIDLQLASSGTGGTYRIDHVTVRESDVLVTFDGPRRPSSLEYWRVDAAALPQANYAMMLSAQPLAPAPIGLPGCTGFVWLQVPIFAIATGTLDGSGRATGDLYVPFVAGGIAFHWQALTLPNACSLGCASRIGF